MSRSSLAILVVLVISAAVGCRGAGFAGAEKTPALVTPQMQEQGLIGLAAAEAPPTGRTQEEALAEVLGRLTQVGALDAEEKQHLMANLREAPQEDWPQIVRHFESALAYREQLVAREEKAAAEQLAAEKSPEPMVAQLTNRMPVVSTEVTRLADSRPPAVPVSFDIQPSQLPDNRASAVTDVPAPPLVLSRPPLQVAQQVSLVSSTSQQPQAAQHSHDWQVHLQSAIQNLEGSVQPAPGSTDEVNQHMRLRLLQLLAGNEETSFQPIPGATAPQQDYWNKQLFAVSTFLDAKRQPDDRRRAAGSLMHLDQARAKLAELATMQVHNLAFVDSVTGYGTYKLHEGAKFRPGDQVTLYAEIENFSSESTPEGYRTRLGTSYEVVDQNGKRVDSAQFPEVEDLCQSPRRDFHMQYTVTLPTRIYPEQYEIRLILTDQQSHKIGQASLPFEIEE